MSLMRCPSVKAYAKTFGANWEGHDATPKCNLSAVNNTLEQFHMCGIERNDQIATKFGRVLTHGRMAMAKDLICGNLGQVMIACFDGLKVCFDDQTISKMRAYQLKIFGAFFYSMAARAGFNIEECEIFQGMSFHRDESYKRERPRIVVLSDDLKYETSGSTRSLVSISLMAVLICVLAKI